MDAKFSSKPTPGPIPDLEIRGWALLKGINGSSKYKEVYLVLQEGTLLSFDDDTFQVGGLNVILNGWVIKDLDKKEFPKQCEFGLKLVPPQKEKEKDKEKGALFMVVGSQESLAIWNERLINGIQIATPIIFGVPLKVAFAKNNYKRCPAIISRMAQFLETNEALGMSGIFRVSAGQGEVMKLREVFNTDPNEVESLISQITDFNVASHIMKLYFRELPDPLLTHERFNSFVEAATNVPKIAEIVQTLPKEHLYTLQFLMKFLTKIAARAAENMMTSRNLAVVFGPTILSSKENDISSAAAAAQSEPIILVCQAMIDNYDTIFAKIEREAIIDADKPRPKPLPIIPIAREENNSDDEKDKDKKPKDKDNKKSKDKKEDKEKGVENESTVNTPANIPPMAPVMPTINPGAVKLRSVLPINKSPRTAEDENKQQESALGPHMLKKRETVAPTGISTNSSDSNSPMVSAAAGNQQAELMARLAARSQRSDLPDPNQQTNPSTTTTTTTTKSTGTIEGRPMPARKPVPPPQRQVTNPSAVQSSVVSHPIPPAHPINPNQNQTSANLSGTVPNHPPPVTPTKPTNLSSTNPSTNPISASTTTSNATTAGGLNAALNVPSTKEQARKSLPPNRPPPGTAASSISPGHSRQGSGSDNESNILVIEVEGLKNQVIELQGTVLKLTEQLTKVEEQKSTPQIQVQQQPQQSSVSNNDARIVALEATVAEQGEKINKQAETIQSLTEKIDQLLQKMKEREKEHDKKHGHSREKSSSNLKHRKKESADSANTAESPSTTQISPSETSPSPNPAISISEPSTEALPPPPPPPEGSPESH